MYKRQGLLRGSVLTQPEKTYSSPLAVRQFTKETLLVDDKPVRDFPRLRAAGTHLADPDRDHLGDVYYRPVSYTHLDVYKRQASRRMGKTGVSGAGGDAVMIPGYIPRYHNRIASRSRYARDFAPDVYKRQASYSTSPENSSTTVISTRCATLGSRWRVMMRQCDTPKARACLLYTSRCV